MYFDLIKLCLCVSLNIPIKLCIFKHGNDVYFELTIPSFYIGHDMRNCFTCTRQTKVAQGTPPQRMPPNRFPETHFGLFIFNTVQLFQLFVFANVMENSRLTIQKRVSLANPLYSSMVERTLKTRQTSTDMNLHAKERQ